MSQIVPAPGTPTLEDQQRIAERPFVAHIKSSMVMKLAAQWCSDNKIDVHYGLPNPMYWLFLTAQERDSFVAKGFADAV